MNEKTISCQSCRELLESYISGDLHESQTREVELHLGDCGECAAAHSKMASLIAGLRGLGASYQPADPFVLPAGGSSSRGPRIGLWQGLAAAAAVLAVVSTSALSVPALAEQLPLPLAREMSQLREERAELERRTDELAEQVEQLQIRLEEIGGEQVPVVRSVPAEDVVEDSAAIQAFAMQFIRAQYARDLETLKGMASDRMLDQLAKRPNDYLKRGGEVVFAQMTDVVTDEDGSFLIFVRLSDAEFNDSTYQQNMTILKTDGGYKVDAADMDA